MKTVTYLITRDEFDDFCELYTPNDCDSDCVDNFDYWNFESTRYVLYLTHFQCNCQIYCTCLTKDERVSVLKEATFWYIKQAQRIGYNEEEINSAKSFVYKYLLENGMVIN